MLHPGCFVATIVYSDFAYSSRSFLAFLFIEVSRGEFQPVCFWIL